MTTSVKVLGVTMALLLTAPVSVRAQDSAGWQWSSMAQLFPIVTAGEPFDADAQLNDRQSYLTQPAIMVNATSPSRRVVVRTTLNFEAVTQADGEYTFGGWGEGFIDKRHPHTLLHEFMVSVNAWSVAGGSASLSVGKGFAPYGTEDPMGRPAVKFPTNHHLSQILERWTVNGVYLHESGWTLEAGVFGGAEPEDAYDLSNIESFGDSWSVRAGRRFGAAAQNTPWEVTASLARVVESHGSEEEVTKLMNVGVRYERRLHAGSLYTLLEASRSQPRGEQGFYAVLGEAQLSTRRHRPYARFELATRPEYHREGPLGTPGFFRYDHDTHTDGATRWAISTLGYGYDLSEGSVAARPFVEVQHNKVTRARGDVDPGALFGQTGFWSLSAGFRLFFGGGPMRMGIYGVLDPMTARPDAKRPGAHNYAH